MFSRQLFYRKPKIVRAGLCLVVTTAATCAGLAPTASAAPAAPAQPPSNLSTKLSGKTVFLDPGHQGSGQNLDRPVNNGYGGTKACQTTGMTALDGTPEHTINWKVANLVKQSLEVLGARVVLSRQDDTGWGGCVDERAAAANRSGANVAISIHADSAPAQDHGFHLIVPKLPVPDLRAAEVQATAGMAASKSVRDAYKRAGFTAAGYAGAVDGMQTRSDIAGPALTEVPNVFIEMGNGANKNDAAQLVSNEGQIKHAIAITTGLVTYLLGAASTGSADSPAASPIPQPNAAPAGNDGSAPQNAAPAVNSTPETTTPAAPQQGTPNAYTPGAAQPQSAPGTAPQYQTAPGTLPQNQTTPGTTPQAGTTPGTQAQPGAPKSVDPNSAASMLVTAAIQLLAPLATSLGLGDVANSELVNLAYTLVSTLIGAAGNAVATATK
ncbi:N-acetylmuramoyl-L-alanine amidase [Nocardia jiangxiensis]|uniref:N-acetylmuramoyl-L-alanine amidase n=1 Tax=Nocardia jiangxiensis TaxID=282685 RepID=A0ABW6S8N4_9NOCA